LRWCPGKISLQFKPEIALEAKKFSETLACVIAHLENPEELCREMRALRKTRSSGIAKQTDTKAQLRTMSRMAHSLLDSHEHECKD